MGCQHKLGLTSYNTLEYTSLHLCNFNTPEEDLQILELTMEASLNNIVAWLTRSGLKVNESKTEICLFTRTANTYLIITILGQQIKTLNQMSVLGLIFDSKLLWGPQITSTLSKASNI